MSGSLTILGLLVLGSAPGAAPYDGHAVVRTLPQTQAEVEAVLELASDVWTERRPAPGVGLDVVVAPGDLASLELSGVDYEMVVEDLQTVVDAERDRLSAGAMQPRADWFSEYRDLASIDAYFDMLADENPDRVTVVELGSSIEGRMIRALEIRGEGEGQPAVFINGTQHAREWISPMVNMCVADRLLTAYETDSEVRALLDQVSIYVVPMVNPDGFEYTWTTERYWRKNRRDGIGVDLNRNWAAGWGEEPGSSDDPESNNYRGTAPFSEPETAAVRDYVLARPEIASHVDFHAYSQLVLFPYSYTYDPPPMLDELRGWAYALSDILDEVHGIDYLPLYGPDFYFASGTAPDWTITELGSFSFTIELRPAGAEQFELGFALPPQQIKPTCDEGLEATLTLARWVLEGGPEPLPDPDPDPDPGDGDGDGDGDGEDDSGGEGDDEEDGGETSGGDDEGAPSGAEQGEAASCACTTSDPAASPAWWSLLALAAVRRRQLKKK